MEGGIEEPPLCGRIIGVIMKLGVLKEPTDETRVAIVPTSMKKLLKAGFEVIIETGAGRLANYSDQAYTDAGATIGTREEALACANIITIRFPGVTGLAEGTTLACVSDPFRNPQHVKDCMKANITLLSMDMIPRRLSRAQSMDVNSSQDNLSGYKAVLLGASQVPKGIPMMTTSAGTIRPAKVVIMGSGVAGLQAIATAKRLGARVEAFDTRDVVEEQVKSLGAKFVKIDLGNTGQTDQGYAKELTPEQITKQKELQSLVCARSDIVITTAQIFGRPAPKIIDEATIKKMKPGSVILDMAVETGGNVEGSMVDEVVDVDGVKVVGISYLASKVSTHASFALSNNIINWITDFYDDESTSINFDFEDEVIQSSVLAYEGNIMNERFS